MSGCHPRVATCWSQMVYNTGALHVASKVCSTKSVCNDVRGQRETGGCKNPLPRMWMSLTLRRLPQDTCACCLAKLSGATGAVLMAHTADVAWPILVQVQQSWETEVENGNAYFFSVQGGILRISTG